MTESRVLRTTRDGTVAILELNRPASKNSLNVDLLEQMRRELVRLREDDDVRAIVVTGANGTATRHCSGRATGPAGRFGRSSPGSSFPARAATQRLIRAVGKSKAMAMWLTGNFWSATRAEAAGVITQVVPDGAALEQARAMARRIAANSPLAVALAKDAALQAQEASLAQGLQHEKRNFYIALRSDDCHEGQAAFLAKRTPQFTER
jgi:enoyl-CoA hydratase